MARRYRPTSTYHGPLLLVRGEVVDDEGQSQWDFGWSDYATGPVDVVSVRSDHMALLRTPAVERVGRVVERALD
jgi:thioesterase domain-containing protein